MMQGKYKLFTLFCGGVLYAAAYPLPFVFKLQFLFPIFSMAVFFFHLLDNEKTFKEDAVTLLVFSLGYYLVGFYWVAFTIEEFGGIPFPWNHLLGLGLIFFILPQYLVFILCKHGIKKYGKNIHYSFSSLQNLFLALFLALLEHFVPQQFPAHVGHPWMHLAPRLGLAPWLGSPAFSFFNFWMALSLIGFYKKKKDFAGPVFYMVFFAVNFFIPLQWNKGEQSMNIRLVQGNIGNLMKTESKKGDIAPVKKVVETYSQLSLLPSENPLDLIIWPETAYPILLDIKHMSRYSWRIPFVIRNTIHKTQSELFMGGYAMKHNNNTYESEYNSAFLFGKEKEKITLKGFYHKIKLIPFGEKLPFGPFSRFLSRYIDNISYFASGNEFASFTTQKGFRFISAICYEILFPEFIRAYLNHSSQVHFIVNLTNDSWYGDTSEPFQHLFLSRWRAIEFNLPVVRMTNTGITSVIFPHGKESSRLSVGEKDILDITLPLPNTEPTFYQKKGVGGLLLLSLFLGGLLFVLKSFFKKVVKTNKS